MKRLILSILSVLLFSGMLLAQPCSGDLDMYKADVLILDVTVDAADNSYSLGYFRGSVTIDSTAFTTVFDVGLIVMKHDANGVFQWVNQVPGQGFYGFSPVVLYDNVNSRVIVAATEFEPNVSENLLIRAFTDAPSWSTVWTQAYTPSGTNSNLSFGARILAMGGDVDSNGAFIISGAFSGPVNNIVSGTSFTSTEPNSETFVVKIDANGNEVWAIQTTGSSSRGRGWALEVDGADDIIIGGHYSGTINLGGGVSHTAVATDVVNPYVAKISSAGAPVWIVGMEASATSNNIYDIAVDGLNAIYFAGNFNASLDIAGNTIVAGTNSEVLIGSVSSGGIYQWAKAMGGTSVELPGTGSFGTHINYSSSLAALFIGGQLVADNINYDGAPLTRPGMAGGFLAQIATADGSLTWVSGDEPFSYASTFNSISNLLVADFTAGNSVNVRRVGISSRPLPVADITTVDGVLNPDETLTAYNDGSSTYAWYKDGVYVGAGATFLATTNGSYKLAATSSFGCTVESKEVLILDGASLESDSLVLVDLYKNTDGPNWTINTNWLTGNVAIWHGIEVFGGRVIRVNLPANNLNGTIAPSLGQLTGLIGIDLNENNVTGALPDNFWNITTLETIQFCCGNNISGTISSAIGGMTNLIGLDLGGNNFTGALPVELFNLTNLEFINLWDNEDNGMNLTGTIPATIGNLSALRDFRISGNSMIGPIPPEIGNLTSILVLDFSGNPLGGTIPTEIGNLTTLTEFSASSAGLSGAIPDGLWALPNLQRLRLRFNEELDVNLPANLNALVQLVEVSLARTRPLGGAFPEGFYSLTNIESIDLGNHRLTGTIDSRIGNLVNLRYLWVWGNQLEGDFPIEILNTQLEGMSISGNSFISIPDFSSMVSMRQLEVEGNLLDFDEIIPNLGITDFRYAPQGRRPHAYSTVDPGGTLTLNNFYDATGNQYQWVFNLTDTISAIKDYQITGAGLDDLGGYYCIVTNPAVPDLTIGTEFYNVAFSGAPRSFTVDNSVGSMADFKSFYAATYGTNGGDTLYVAGSPAPYDIGYSLFENPRIIYGPGYFLNENPETQASGETAQIGRMGFKKGAEGSEVYGLDIDELTLNNQASILNDTLTNVHFTGNRIKRFGLGDDCKDILINRNYIGTLGFFSTPVIGVSRSYQNIFIENNIIDTVTTVLARATAAKNEMVNVIFDRNTVSLFTDSIQDATVTNSIINDYQATANTTSNIVDFTTAAFTNSSGTLSIDNDFVPTNTGINAGAFSGAVPYILSGIPPVPHLFVVTNTGRIRINIQGKAPEGDVISKLNYKLGQDGVVVDKGTVTKLESGNPVAALFRPRLGKVTPGGTYNLMIWAKDDSGKKSVHQNLSFVAETTNASGNIFTSANQPVTNGEVLLFEINQEGSAFDTLATSLNNQGAFSFSNIVIGDYLALAKADTVAYPGQLPTYYKNVDLWEEADTLLIDTNNPVFDITLIAEPKPAAGTGVITGILDEEFEEGSSSGRETAKKRVAKAGVSMRRQVKTGRTTEAVYELIAYTVTNENGEFIFKNLPDDSYRINIQYPGYPMDTLSNINITLAQSSPNNYNVEALVKDGKIAVTLITVTGIMEDIIRSINVYPNPTSAEGITVQFHDNMVLQGKAEIQLFDIAGNLALSKTLDIEKLHAEREIYLPLENFQKGTYILKLRQSKKELGTVRLIVH